MSQHEVPHVEAPETSLLGKPKPVVPAKEGVFETYANQINIAWSLFDITIRFGQLVPTAVDEGGPSWATEESAAITLPWGQAKALRDMLSELVARYEEKNGELKPIDELKLA